MVIFLRRRNDKEITQKGFTLVEITVASVLLAMICAGLFSIVASSRKIISSSSQRLEATKISQAALENLRAYLDWGNWSNTSSLIYPASSSWSCYNFSNNSNSLAQRMSSAFGGTEFATKYQGSWCYKIENATAPYEYRKATVEVRWNEFEP